MTLVGCNQPTDSELWEQAIEAVARGEADTVDVKGRTDIDDDDVRKLADLPGLRCLRLNRARVSDEALAEVLPTLQQLEVLSLSDTRIGNRSLQQLAHIPSLRDLTLDGVPITDLGLKHLSRLENLERLSLWKNFVTNRGCVHLGKLKGLRRLSLDETQVTDSGLRHLYALKELEYLSLWKTNVSDAGVKQLERALPNVKVNR
jgi:hypothetical protein